MPKNNVSFFMRIAIITAILSIVLLFILAGLMYVVHLPQSQVSFGIFFIYILSCFVGGFFTGKKMKVRRFLWGFGFGVCYFLLLLIISIVLGNNITSNINHTISVLLTCALSGMIGGIIG